jgi:hypothetical protein
MDMQTFNFGEIIWWALIVVLLAMLWRLVSTVQSLVEVLKKFGERFTGFKVAEPPSTAVDAVPATARPSVPVAADHDGIPGEIIAVIAAAVDAVMHGPHRILAINPVDVREASQSVTAWAVEGRRQIFQSHTLR